MNKTNLRKRLLCALLVIGLLAGLAVPVSAAYGVHTTFTQIDNSAVTAKAPGREPVEPDIAEESYADSDMVRVSIVLEKAGTIEAGYAAMDIAQNASAMDYRTNLAAEQRSVMAQIEKATREELDVVWNLTLAANIISANVKYGQIETIERIDGVKNVLIETRYEPAVVGKSDVQPNMATSGKQIGSAPAWAAGYTGAGSRIAIIDTGTDVDHQSFSAEGFAYSLQLKAEDAGMTLEDYMAGLDLLDLEEIRSVASLLNVRISAESAYANSKIPFGYNYADKDYYITHIRDIQGEHGSHVTGIAAANAYIPSGSGEFSRALDSVMVQGVAPDAQIITMKIYGVNDGGMESDYMAAIEDAIVLGCDAINLSLGSAYPGTSRNSVAEYQAIMDNLVESGVVLTVSAGNSGYWAENARNAGYLYTDDVSMHTNSSPGSYTNALAVASVNNDGATGYYVTVGDRAIFYTEITGYGNEPYATIPGAYDYVLVDGYGSTRDWSAAGAAMKGAVAVCSRGDLAIYEVANNAVRAGAAGVLIYNDRPGAFSISLHGYAHTNPVAAITQADGAAMKAAATAVMDENGKVLYYTGKLTVNGSAAPGQFNSDYYTMSSFSSWGVPGSLELKPEITAPGGGINSVYGRTPYGGGFNQYEVMDGTSMAAPQVAGMVAVFAQYAREMGLEEKTGKDIRTLANSLLMSTAVPMIDGNSGSYYPVIQQGSGLGNIGLAISADSYLLMDQNATASHKDGKVKAELGDDPARTGRYSFSFTINNITDEALEYDLYADFFIQDFFQDYANDKESKDQMAYYMDTQTRPIDVTTSFKVNGKTMGQSMDFNGDGTVDQDDGTTLLDYTTGLVTKLTNADHADLDGDGDIDSHDAYAFFTRTDDALRIPANGSVNVMVNITLSDAAKALIEEYYPNGTYVQGYVFVSGAASAEGIVGTTHSIPVLGFYGNWTDPSMFDVGDSVAYAHGEEYRTPYIGNQNSNIFTIAYGGDTNESYRFGGNPYVLDETYMPERNAINSENGDMLTVTFAAIRNVAASRFIAVNKTTGKILMEEESGSVFGAFYYPGDAKWHSIGYMLGSYFLPEDASQNDVLELSMILAPEYNVDARGNVDWDALGEGAAFTVPMTVDNDAPVVEDVWTDADNHTMTVVASDNQYVASVVLYNKSGTNVYTYVGAKQDIAPNEAAEFVLDISRVNGTEFIVQVMDYAMNTSTWTVSAGTNDQPGHAVQTASAQDQNTGSATTVYSAPELMAKDETVTVTVTAKDASGTEVRSANGRMTVDYDGKALTLVSASVNADYVSVNDTTSDAVVFAYVDLDGIDAGEAVATLTFRQSTDGAEGMITITADEVNDSNPGYVEEVGGCPSKAFTDLNLNQWYHEYTDYVLANGLMNGMGDNKFAPETALTRGMLVTTLYRLAGEPAVTEKATFADVRDNAYYADAVAWAQGIGVVKGITETTFCPEMIVTREQAATFLYRYVTEYLNQQAAAGADLSGFKDVASISDYAREPLAWAVAEAIFAGFPDNTMQPRGSLTRAQMAKLLAILDQNF